MGFYSFNSTNCTKHDETEQEDVKTKLKTPGAVKWKLSRYLAFSKKKLNWKPIEARNIFTHTPNLEQIKDGGS